MLNSASLNTACRFLIVSGAVLTLINAAPAHGWPKLFKKSQNSGAVSGPVNTPTSQMTAPSTAPIVESNVGPSVGKYFISGATNRLNQFIMVKPGGNYELFSPNGMSLGSGVYSYSAVGGSVYWQTGPMTSPDFNGNQRYEIMNGGRTESIRVQMQAYATCTR